MPLRFKPPVAIEDLDAVILPIGDVDPSVFVARNVVWQIELSGPGTGLANIRARLAALYGNAGQLSLGINAPRGVTVSIAVPLTISATQAGSQ